MKILRKSDRLRAVEHDVRGRPLYTIESMIGFPPGWLQVWSGISRASCLLAYRRALTHPLEPVGFKRTR